MTEPAAHINLTLGEAAKAITGFEIIGIEDKFGTPMERLSGSKMLIGVVWAHRRRAAIDSKTVFAWSDVEKMTLQQLEDFFEAEPDEPDVADGFSDGADSEGNAVAA